MKRSSGRRRSSLKVKWNKVVTAEPDVEEDDSSSTFVTNMDTLPAEPEQKKRHHKKRNKQSRQRRLREAIDSAPQHGRPSRTVKRKPKPVRVKMKLKNIPTTKAGVINKLVAELTSFVDAKRREFDEASFAVSRRKKQLTKLAHTMHNLIGHTEALGFEKQSDVVESRDLLEILLDKEEGLGMQFPLEWKVTENAADESEKDISEDASSFVVNQDISRKSLFCRHTDIQKLQDTLARHTADISILQHTIRQYKHVHDRTYKANIELKRTVKYLEEYISKLKVKHQQLVRAIETEEKKMTLLKVKLKKQEKVSVRVRACVWF